MGFGTEILKPMVTVGREVNLSIKFVSFRQAAHFDGHGGLRL